MASGPVPNTVGNSVPEDTNHDIKLIVSPRAAMLLTQDPAIHRAPTVFAPPATASLVSMPAATNRASTQRPESQEDWEAKKEILRSLYMDENMPLKDLVSLMSSKYSFSATVRMYKRQFSKWDWRKYNTKGRQRHSNSELAETRGEKTACIKRSTRQRVIGLTNQGQNSSWRGHTYHAASSDRKGHQDPSIPILILFGNQCNRRTEEVYINLRDLVYGSARQCSAYKSCSKFEWLIETDHDVLGQFRLAYRLFKDKDFQKYGAVLRQAFRTVDLFTEMKSCRIVQMLLLDVPYILLLQEQKAVLQLYLHYVSQMLSVAKPGEPLGLIMKSMHAIYVESPAQFTQSLAQVHDVLADCFMATRGTDDLSSLNARVEALCFSRDFGVSTSDGEGILENYNHLLDEVIGAFGEDSQETIELEYCCIYDMRRLRSSQSIENLYQQHIRRLRRKNGTSWDDWSQTNLNYATFSLWNLARFYRDTGSFESSITCLEECIRMLDHMVGKYGNTSGYGARAAEYRMDLIKVLTTLGRLDEASEVRLGVAGSDYLKEVMDNDAECNSPEI
ncbi:hypothetical protein LY78DRAFT_680694 [Colletotrichum sublineola]|nr:hypothetical protein LY78DRAFT_680694 [Colletotrichum sublineola]